MLPARYATPNRVIHWIMAILIIVTIPVGVVMVQPGLDREVQNALYVYHKNVGVLLLVFVALRLAIRLRYPPPAPPAHLPRWQVHAAAAAHGALYVLMVVVPVAGYVRVRAGGFPIESLDAMGVPTLVARSRELEEIAVTVHYSAGIAIVAVLALHVGAAVFHGVVKRDGVFSRMWPPFGGGHL